MQVDFLKSYILHQLSLLNYLEFFIYYFCRCLFDRRAPKDRLEPAWKRIKLLSFSYFRLIVTVRARDRQRHQSLKLAKVLVKLFETVHDLIHSLDKAVGAFRSDHLLHCGIDLVVTLSHAYHIRFVLLLE